MAKLTRPIVREGYPFIIISIIITFILIFLWPILGFIGFLITLFVIYFFRNPKREIPDVEGAILSPADGTVIQISDQYEPYFLKKPTKRVSIFMSIFNVHVNRIPYSGKIVDLVYNKGKFLIASKDKASFDNEQNAILMEIEGNKNLVFVQIAGFIARRIVCYLKKGDVVNRGDPFGLIRFGSRVDIYFPEETAIKVKVGEKVKGGETILGIINLNLKGNYEKKKLF